MGTWRELGRALFGTPWRALISAVVIIALVVTGVVQLILDLFIATVVMPLLVLFLLLATVRYAFFGRGRKD